MVKGIRLPLLLPISPEQVVRVQSMLPLLLIPSLPEQAR